MDRVLLQQVQKERSTFLPPTSLETLPLEFYDRALLNDVTTSIWPLLNTTQMLLVAEFRNLDTEEA